VGLDSGNGDPMTDEQLERLIRLVANEAADAALIRALDNGIMPKIREQARAIADETIKLHLVAATASQQQAQEIAKWKLIAIVAVSGGGAGGIMAALVEIIR